MSVGTLTRADLADALQREVGLSRADSAKLVEEILEHMCDALSCGVFVLFLAQGSHNSEQ